MRTLFCVSDHTGLTTETLAHSLMTRFEGVRATYVVHPFIDTKEKATEVVAEVDEAADGGARPIVFSTITDRGIYDVVKSADALVINLFDPFLGELAAELAEAPTHEVGVYHGISDTAKYDLRLDAVDFALSTDDGLGARHYGRADVIVVGVSRVGKTPTCLFMSMQYAIRAANYPITDDDATTGLPPLLAPHSAKLYGLTLDPVRLHQIREQRRPGTAYSSIRQCSIDIQRAEELFRSERIPVIDTTAKSIEEITATIIEEASLTRRID